MTESETDAQETAQGVTLTRHEVAALRAAGGWARRVGGVGSVALGLLTLLIIDVAVKNPPALVSAIKAQGVGFAATVLAALATPVAVALLWGYGRSVAAFFRGGGDHELGLAFRRIRQFFILWTCLSAVTAVIGIIVALTTRPFVRM
jgi:hypothetical protein